MAEARFAMSLPSRWFYRKIEDGKVVPLIRPTYSIGITFKKGTVWTTSDGDVFEATSSVDYLPVYAYRYYDLSNSIKWVKTNITRKPSMGVYSLSLRRTSPLNFEVSWKIPSEASSKTSTSRAEQGKFNLHFAKNNYYTYWFGLNEKSHTFSLSKSSWYPYNRPNGNEKLPKLTSVKAVGMLFNDFGYGFESSVSLNLGTPEQPTIGTFKEDEKTGIISVVVSAKAETEDRPRTDTVVSMYTRVGTEKSKENKQATKVTSSSAITMTIDAASRQLVQYNQFYQIRVAAYSRGPAGDSKTVTKSYYISYPKIPTLKGQTIPKGNPSNTRCLFTVKIDKDEKFPVTGVQMQALRSVDYNSADEIPAETGQGQTKWQNVGMQDNGNCTAMSVATEDLLPEEGKKTWVRLLVWNTFASRYRYSAPIRLKSLERPAPVEPSAQDDNVWILSCTVGSDGLSASVRVGWDKNGTDDSNWTEVSWADNQDAWRSTQQPSSFSFADATWNEGSATVGNVTYGKSAHLLIRGLEPGNKYYITARRMMKPQQGDATYGPYCTKSALTIAAEGSAVPETLTLAADTYVLRGEQIMLSWDYDSDMQQQSWSVYDRTNNKRTVLSRASDTRHAFSLPFYRDSRRNNPIVAIGDDAIDLSVTVMVGGRQISSNTVRVLVVTPPVLQVGAISKLTSNNLSINAYTDTPSSDVSVVINSRGIVKALPDGGFVQTNGDTVASFTTSPTWEVVSSISSVTTVAQAKTELDNAEAAYKAKVDAYNNAMDAYKNALSVNQSSTDRLEDSQRDLYDAQQERDSLQQTIDGTDPESYGYDELLEQLDELSSKVAFIQSTIATLQQDISNSQQDMSDAQDTMDSITWESEEEAYNAAIDAYSLAVMNAMPELPDGANAYKTVIDAPDGIELFDGGRYDISAFATASIGEHSVTSERQSTQFEVSYAHQAPVPARQINIQELNETDEYGNNTFGTIITFTPPDRGEEGDVYDLYRVSKDGSFLALSDIPLNATVRDEFAVFARTTSHYDIVCRTKDGDVDWLRYDYNLSNMTEMFKVMVRIDWDGKHVELYRDVAPSDSYDKPFESHMHLDGTVSGHWNRGNNRTMDISASLIADFDEQQERLLRELAKYDGPCLVRTSDGMWVQGDVQVNGMSRAKSSAKIDVSLSVTQVTPTEAFTPVIVGS